MAIACKKLTDKVEIPVVGFGTWQAQEDVLEEALENALKCGYRHIDTAYVYENEHIIGRVLRKWLANGLLKREDLFVVTKLPMQANRPEDVEKYLRRSLKSLQLEYVDLYLIHGPVGFKDNIDGKVSFVGLELDLTTDLVAIWKEMEKQVDLKLTRTIGISNFNIHQIKRILSECRIRPCNLQVEIHVYFQQKELLEFCDSENITVTAYSPLGSRGIKDTLKLLNIDRDIPDLMSIPVVLEIGKKHNVVAAQVLLRYLIQRGCIVIPKSVSAERMKINLDLFSFSLDVDDMERLKRLDQGWKARVCDLKFLDGIEKHPEFPFDK